MKLSIILLAAGLVSTAPVAMAQTAATTTSSSQDRALDSRIEKRLADEPSLKRYHLEASVENGVVTLSGTVATEAERARAAELAKVQGVTRVENKIVADLDAATRPKGTAGKTADAAKKGAEKTKDAGEAVVDKTKEGLSKTGEVITDTWITGRIKSKYMGDEALRASDISVKSDDHIVTLSGSVVSAAAHAKAIGMAREVEGVKNVVDKLRIVPKQ